MLTFVVDIYTKNLETLKNASIREKSYLDKTGYFAEERIDSHTFHPIKRQLDFFGGLRWRFEQYVPQDQRKIDRIAIFKASKGLTISKITPLTTKSITPMPAPGITTSLLQSFRFAQPKL